MNILSIDTTGVNYLSWHSEPCTYTQIVCAGPFFVANNEPT